MPIIALKESVGRSGKNNADDVITVRDRLIQLGYNGITGVIKGTEKKFVRAIKLFQSIYKGESKLKGDGRVDLLGNSHKWLAADNAPGWLDFTGYFGPGFKIARFDYGNSFTSTWMSQQIYSWGMKYFLLHQLSESTFPSMWIRDLSPKFGGKTKGHGSHQTGLDVDMRLPFLPPRENEFDPAIFFGTDNYKKTFHRKAALAQARVIKSSDPNKFWFNDKEFIKERLTTHLKHHYEHFHIRLKPQARDGGSGAIKKI